MPRSQSSRPGLPRCPEIAVVSVISVVCVVHLHSFFLLVTFQKMGESSKGGLL